MKEKFIIGGERPLSGKIKVRGAKNAATPILASSLLTKEACIFNNVPLIKDVLKMIEIIEEMGAEVEWLGERKVRIQAKDIDPEKIDQTLISQIRSSILFMGPLLARFHKVKINHPGGCVIGARPVGSHLDALEKMGAKITIDKIVSPTRGRKSPSRNFYNLEVENGLQGGEVVLSEFSVTATENAMMAAALTPKKTVIKIAAAEPHVQDLAAVLRKMVVEISGEGTHTIEIKGKKNLGGVKHSIMSDPIEAGTFILMGVATKGKLVVEDVPVEHMDFFFDRLRSFGACFEIDKRSVTIKDYECLKISRVQSLPHPGLPTDLQSIFGVLATQAEGLTLIQDPLYEGRLKYLEELNKMGAEIIVCDPHRAVIQGPTQLYGTELGPMDLRAGAALIIAGLIAKGTTVVRNANQIDRGYEQIEKRLREIGAEIVRVEE